jgi:type I restriction enzyme S subunit
MSWKKVKLGEFLKQYRFENLVQDDIEYKQVTISKYDGVCFRGVKKGKEIGRKRQFLINLEKYPNTLMFVRQGVEDGSIGIVPKELNGCIVTENMPMFSIENILVDFLRIIIKSPYFKTQVSQIQTTGSAQKSIHERQLLEIEIPLPDIETQKQIISNINLLEQKATGINTELNHQLDTVKKLRQAFLREAMQGKLIEQNPNDEPASELLKKIKAEKEKLPNKRTKEKPLTPIKPEEIPFEIPKNWVWCKIGEITTSIVPNRDKPLTFTGDINWITQSNFSDDDYRLNYNLTGIGLSREEVKKYNCRVMPVGSVIMSCVGQFDLVCLVEKEIVANQQLHCFIPYGDVETMYLCYAVKYFSKLIEKEAIQTTIKYINKTKCESIFVSLPPLAEQERIVNKLDKLMSFCDELEKSIKQSKQQNEKLLQQVLREALSPN